MLCLVLASQQSAFPQRSGPVRWLKLRHRRPWRWLRCPPGPGAPALTAALFFNQPLKVCQKEMATFPPPSRRCLWGLGCPARAAPQSRALRVPSGFRPAGSSGGDRCLLISGRLELQRAHTGVRRGPWQHRALLEVAGGTSGLWPQAELRRGLCALGGVRRARWSRHAEASL